MNKDYWIQWLKYAGMRAIKTCAQTAIATIGVAYAMSDVNWMYVGSATLLAGIVSMLMSTAGLPELRKPAIDENEGFYDDAD